MHDVKFADEARTALDIRLVPYGGSINGRDTAREFFSAKSNLCLDWFPDRRPLLYHHGKDAAVQVTPIGYIESVELKDDGAWARAQLDAHNRYYQEIAGLIDAQALGASSGAMGHLVKVDAKTGHIDRWPLVEGSLTPTPCEPLLATVDWETAKAHYKSAGLDVDSLKAVWSTADVNDLDDGAFLYVEDGGTKDDGGKTTPRTLRHFPYRDSSGAVDLPHLRNALARIPQSDLPDEVKRRLTTKATALLKEHGGDAKAAMADDTAEAPEGSYEDLMDDLQDALNPKTPWAMSGYTCLLATFPTHVIVCRYDYDGDCSYWDIPYTYIDDTITLGTATQVEQTYVPAKASHDGACNLALDATSLSRHAAAVSLRTKDVDDRRVKAGRQLSTTNRTALEAAATQCDAAAKAIRDLLMATDRMDGELAKAAYLASPEALALELELLQLAHDSYHLAAV